jgi:hypothetical protein
LRLAVRAQVREARWSRALDDLARPSRAARAPSPGRRAGCTCRWILPAGSQGCGAETACKEHRAGKEARRAESSGYPQPLDTGDARPDPGGPTKEERACRRSIWTPR